MNKLDTSIGEAVARGDLLPTARENIESLLNNHTDDVCRAVVEELVDTGEWRELNDRFFQTLAFGTGGLRGRTIGRHVTKVEQGNAPVGKCPEIPCVGTNTMNWFNLGRASLGLIQYVREIAAEGTKPGICISHDTRHFSRAFARQVARWAVEQGCETWLFDGPRSTPELSFAVRQCRAQAGVMLTASHNPPHDNGYKVYFDDGAQIVEPHASKIVAAVESITNTNPDPLPEKQQGKLHIMGPEMDEIYLNRVRQLVIRPDALKNAGDVKVVFTNLHGTGGILVPGLLREMGFAVETVAAQDAGDGAFPTVKSPNPENAEALKMAIDQAVANKADLVIGTDPDCDRMGVAVRDESGGMQILSGNQIGSLMAYYRLQALTDEGILTESNRDRACLISTFVTTRLQDRIAAGFGAFICHTLTGFKYIGAKLTKYENSIPLNLRDNYRDLTEEESRDLRLEHSRYFVFGGEESYGYLGSDFIRDKDGNGAAVMFCEMVAWARSRGLTVLDLLDEVYSRFGYFREELQALTFEGADGAVRIARLADSYSESPPEKLDGVKITAVRNFLTEDHVDEEGDPIPREKMIMVDLEDGRGFAVRPSGTEPKIKYYLFSSAVPAEGAELTAGELTAARASCETGAANLWRAIEEDIRRRLAD